MVDYEELKKYAKPSEIRILNKMRDILGDDLFNSALNLGVEKAHNDDHISDDGYARVREILAYGGESQMEGETEPSDDLQFRDCEA